MLTKFNPLMWRIALIVMTLSIWVSLVAAQDEVEAATEEAPNFGIVGVILLTGLVAIAALGFLMNSGNSSNNGDDQ